MGSTLMGNKKAKKKPSKRKIPQPLVPRDYRRVEVWQRCKHCGAQVAAGSRHNCRKL